MLNIGKVLLGILFLVLAAVMPPACESSNEGSGRDVKVGGDNGVVVDHSASGTTVKVGGDHGVVVDHSHD
jgi:predicted small secreted protein